MLTNAEGNEEIVTRPKRKSQSAKAGLKFPVARIHRHLKEGWYAKRISVSSSIYLAAVMEYLTTELAKLGANATKESKKRRMMPKHLLWGMCRDDEMKKLVSGIYTSGIDKALAVDTSRENSQFASYYYDNTLNYMNAL